MGNEYRKQVQANKKAKTKNERANKAYDYQEKLTDKRRTEQKKNPGKGN